MSFTDAIKKSVLEGFAASDISAMHILVTLGFATLLGLYIFLIYRTTAKSGFYNKSFNKSLAILPVITAGILLAMQSNLIISLGMVGALSIVRFRNAVKDSMDLVFLFWSISIGIITGTGLFRLALLTTVVITVFIFILDIIPAAAAPYLLVVSVSLEGSDEKVSACVENHAKKAKKRSYNITQKGSEMIFELYVKDGAALVKSVASIKGVTSVNLLSHNGEVRF